MKRFQADIKKSDEHKERKGEREREREWERVGGRERERDRRTRLGSPVTVQEFDICVKTQIVLPS